MLNLIRRLLVARSAMRSTEPNPLLAMLDAYPSPAHTADPGDPTEAECDRYTRYHTYGITR